MDLEWTAAEQELRTGLREYVEDHMLPGWTHTDRDMPTAETREAVIDFCRGLAERGLLTPAWPQEYGGRGASRWEQTIISEELWGVGEPRGPQYMNVNWIGPAIMQLGTEDQKTEHLNRISSGDAMWCQGFSEPDAGSDLSSLKTAAVRDGDMYVVNGQKIWTSYAHAADYCFLLVRTDPKAENPRRGISVLLVPMNLDGIEVREIPTLGVHHLVHEVFFHDVLVSVDCRIGAENDGWSIIRTLLANERVGNARHEWVDRSLDRLVQEAGSGGTDLTRPEVQTALGRAASWTAASRILNYVAVQAWSEDSPEYPNLAAVYRASMAQMELGCAHTFMDVLGPEALVEGSRGDYQLVGGTLSTIGGGSYEMQLNNIAAYQLGLPKE